MLSCFIVLASIFFYFIKITHYQRLIMFVEVNHVPNKGDYRGPRITVTTPLIYIVIYESIFWHTYTHIHYYILQNYQYLHMISKCIYFFRIYILICRKFNEKSKYCHI